MAITLTAAYLAELRKNVNEPCVILEVALDSGTVKWGTHTGGFGDVAPIIKSVSSLQNKIDTKKGYSTRGQLTVVITGRDNFKSLVQNNYLKNRRVTRKDGFIASGFAYSDYAQTYSGVIYDWSRKGDELTLIIKDDLNDDSVDIPTENALNTQYIDYRNTNPVDIMTNILNTQLGISTAYTDNAKFTSEKGLWLSNWTFDRVVTEPQEANDYLNELQIETNSYIIHDGEKISYKVFAPPVPGQTIEEWTDNNHILKGSLSVKSGYNDNFYNRVVVRYDYDESGSDGSENYASAHIETDTVSQSTAQWNETRTKEIRSKWIRSQTFTPITSTSITGITLYHVARENSTGSGTLTYNASSNHLQWTAPGGTIGEAVKLTKSGKVQIYDADKNKYVRILVTTSSLPVTDKTQAVSITSLKGSEYASTLARKLLSRFRNPAASISLDIDINNVAWNSEFIKPTDIKDITTDEAFEFGDSTWNRERMLLTSVRPDFDKGKVSVEAIETKMYRRYGFIAPAGLPDYTSATDAQKEYAFIGNSSNEVGGVDGYYIW